MLNFGRQNAPLPLSSRVNRRGRLSANSMLVMTLTLTLTLATLIAQRCRGGEANSENYSIYGNPLKLDASRGSTVILCRLKKPPTCATLFYSCFNVHLHAGYTTFLQEHIKYLNRKDSVFLRGLSIICKANQGVFSLPLPSVCSPLSRYQLIQ